MLKFTQPQQVKKTLKTKWCQDPTPAEPGDKYEESADTPPVISSANAPVPSVEELPTYGEDPVPPPPPPPQQPAALYDAPPPGQRKGRQGRQGKNGGQRNKRRPEQQ